MSSKKRETERKALKLIYDAGEEGLLRHGLVVRGESAVAKQTLPMVANGFRHHQPPKPRSKRVASAGSQPWPARSNPLLALPGQNQPLPWASRTYLTLAILGSS